MIGIIGRPDSLIASECLRLMEGVYLEAGRSDPRLFTGLIYAACIESHPNVMEVAYSQMTKSFDLSVNSLIHTIQNLRLANGCGIIVLNSAFVGRKHTGGGIAYCAAKAAQRQVILNASVQLGQQGNFIVGIAPAFIDTKPGKRMNTDPEYRARMLSQMNVTQFGRADEVARLAQHLLNHGRYHNGATLDMSGGWSF